MNLRIPLNVFAVASVIGVMAVTTTAMSMQKAYSIEAWCFTHDGPHCFFHEGSQAKCNAAREELVKGGATIGSCWKD